MLQRPLAYLCVVGLGDGIFKKSLLELVEGDQDAEDLGQRVLKVALGACLGELDLLSRSVSRGPVEAGDQGTHLV